MKRRSATTTVLGTLGVALLALVVAAGVWRAEGGRWFDVRTASMGTAAPVGTLLLTRPATLAEIDRGDIATFHAPGSGKVYSHRVVKRTAAGLTTQGDINPAADAWTVPQRDVVGKVVWKGPALGWLIRGFPLLLLCAGVVWLLASLVRPRLRGHVRVLGASLSFAMLGLLLHPWVGLQRISTARADQGVVLQLVSTGLLPVRVSAIHGEHSVRLVDGEVGKVHAPHRDSHGFYSVVTSLDLSFWWWIGLAVVCLLPLLWCLVVGLPVAHDDVRLPGGARAARAVQAGRHRQVPRPRVARPRAPEQVAA